MNRETGSTYLHGAHVRANGIRQHYLRFGGSGSPLVIIPGIVTPAILWSDVADRLGKHFDTYVLDVRGRGLSEGGDHLDYGLDACASDVPAFIQALGLGRVALLGHSMGARIALRAAHHDDAPYERLLLAEPPMSGPGRRHYPSRLEPILALLEAARRGDGWEGLRASPLPPWPQPLMRVRAEWLHTCDPRAATVAHRGFHEDDIHRDIAAIRIPSALFVGVKGGVILESDEREVREINPSIAIYRVENAGHQLQVDNFDGFFSALNQALGTNL